MISRQELKQRAKAQLGGGLFTSRWLTALLVCFVSTLILSAVNVPSAVSGAFQTAKTISQGGTSVSVQFSFFGFAGMIVFLLLSGPLTYGRNRMFLKQTRDNEDMVFADLFKGFTDDFSGNLLLALATTLFTFLWSLLFVIPGIVKAYAYSQVFYIKADHPDYDWQACINESKRLMQGRKGELFMLDLSFIGWFIVGALCLGVGTLWVEPYMEATKAHFYQNLLIADGARQAADVPPEPWNGPQPQA